MRRLASILVIGGILLVIALASRAPASLVSPRIERLTDDRLLVADPQGTLWHGSAVLTAGDERFPVAWNVHPMSLLRGQVALTLTPTVAGATQPRGEILTGKGSTHLRDFRIELPAAVVIAAAVPRPRLDAKGMVEVTANEFDWPPRNGGGAIRATWHDAAVGLTGSNEAVGLGEVSARLTSANGELKGPLDNLGGEFAIDGTLTLRQDGSGGVSGIVRTRAPDDPRYNALLSIGTPDAGGVRVEWQWPGR